MTARSVEDVTRRLHELDGAIEAQTSRVLTLTDALPVPASWDVGVEQREELLEAAALLDRLEHERTATAADLAHVRRYYTG